jgi:hypothetical protein
MFKFDMVKRVILLLTGPFNEFDCFEVSVFERKRFFLLRNIRKIDGVSNQFEPSMVFDPSEFKGPRFDCTVNLVIANSY